MGNPESLATMTASVIAVGRLFCQSIATDTLSPGETTIFEPVAPPTEIASPRKGLEIETVNTLSAREVSIAVDEAVASLRVPAVKWNTRSSPWSPLSTPRTVTVRFCPGKRSPIFHTPDEPDEAVAEGSGSAEENLNPNGYRALRSTSLTGAFAFDAIETTSSTGCPEIVSLLPETTSESGNELKTIL